VPLPTPGIPQNPQFVTDATGQFGQTALSLNQNLLGTSPGQINPGSGGLVS